MTHTLHRSGTVDSLKTDYVMLVMPAQGFNNEGAAPKMRKVLEIILNHNPVSFGDMRTGNYFRRGLKTILENTQDNSICHGVFTNKKDLEGCIAELKEADLGMSVVVSGLIDEAYDSAKKVGLTPHSMNLSLGVWGKKELLPEQNVLDITTQCGHHCISPLLVKKLVNDVKRDKICIEEAARILAKQCVCGVANPSRTEKILEEMIEKS